MKVIAVEFDVYEDYAIKSEKELLLDEEGMVWAIMM